MESTYTCSKCKKETSNKQENVSIHKTLAYSRCRCHRSFSYQNKQSVSRVSTSASIPGPINILPANKMMLQTNQSDLHVSKSHMNATHVHHQLPVDNCGLMTEASDSELLLPPIYKQRALVAEFSCISSDDATHDEILPNRHSTTEFQSDSTLLPKSSPLTLPQLCTVDR